MASILKEFKLTDYRYNPFTQTFSSYGHGYSGNPKEIYTIPSSSPYFVYLNEIPREDSPSTLLINQQSGPSFTEVSFSTPPAAGQFRVVYGGDETQPISIVGQGTIEFNSADAGKIMEIAYYGMGSILQKQFFNTKDNEQNKKPFELLSYADDASIIIADSRAEDISGVVFIVTGGNYTITDSGLANGPVYAHFKNNGDGTASAYLDLNAGTYNAEKGGYYHTDGAKVLYQMVKSTGPIYSRKARRWPNDPGGELVTARWASLDLDTAITIRSLIF